jgi:Ser/Thr protein kinase RdoA (MazF antagonist)
MVVTAADTAAPTRVSVPILRSLVSADAMAPVLEEAYGLSGVRVELIKALTLHTYRVQSRSGAFALRIYPASRSEREVRGELEFLAYLAAEGLAVGAAVARPDGSRFLALEVPEGTRYAALFPFAPGVSMDHMARPEPAHLRAYGEMLARLHQAADAMPTPPPRPALGMAELVDGPAEELLRVLGPYSSGGLVTQLALDKIRGPIAALPAAAPVWGLCHGDTGPGNVLVTRDGRLTLIDFEFCGPGWRVHDIAAFFNDVSDESARTFGEGYTSVRAVTQEEREAIVPLQAAHLLWVLAMRMRHLNEWGSWLFSEAQVIHTFQKMEGLLARLR